MGSFTFHDDETLNPISCTGAAELHGVDTKPPKKPPSSLNMVVDDHGTSPLSAIFRQKLRPFLDVVDRLRSLGLADVEDDDGNNISLPTILVVGDQSSGKSSVLESLSGVELPKGQGIVTRVPLVLRLKGSNPTASQDSSGHDALLPDITISYEDEENANITEKEIPDAISRATVRLVGNSKAIADKPITLNICRPGVPDLTLVDLPGITRVPVHDQPDNIFDLIKDLIMHYIRPEATIILNVLSAATDFSVCESIRMSRQVDPEGMRTLAVVTKVDMCPEGLLQKITDDAVKIGLGYICVRNKTAKDASFEEARLSEKELFASHPELKNLNKSIVGIEALANRLVQLQTQSISSVLPNLIKQIDSSLHSKKQKLQQIGISGISNLVDASVTFFNVSSSVKKSLQDALISGDDCNAVDLTGVKPSSDDASTTFNYTTLLHEEFARFSGSLTTERGLKLILKGGDGGYIDIIARHLSKSQGVNLPNLVPQAIVEKTIRQLLDSVANSCASELPSFVHDAARKVAFAVVAKHASRFPSLNRLYRAACEKALSDCKSKCVDTITRVLEMEKAVVYTTSTGLYNCHLITFLGAAAGRHLKYSVSYSATVEGLKDEVDAGPLSRHQEGTKQAVCSLLAYWIILSRRLADQICHELRFSFSEALLKVTDEVVGEVMRLPSGAENVGMSPLEEVMAEEAEVVHERMRLHNSIDKLTVSKGLVSQVLGDAWVAYQ